MTDDTLHRALREGLDGALKELQAQRRDLHKVELRLTADLTELRANQAALAKDTAIARLDERLSALEKRLADGAQVEAAKVTAQGQTKGQLYMLIGTLATALISLAIGIAQLVGG